MENAVQFAVDLAVQNPKTATVAVTVLGGAYAVQTLAAWLAKVTKRSHPTVFNTWATRIAAFPLRYPASVVSK